LQHSRSTPKAVIDSLIQDRKDRTVILAQALKFQAAIGSAITKAANVASHTWFPRHTAWLPSERPSVLVHIAAEPTRGADSIQTIVLAYLITADRSFASQAALSGHSAGH